MKKITLISYSIIFLTIALTFGVFVYQRVETNSLKVFKVVKVSVVKEEDMSEKIKLNGTVVPKEVYNIYGKGDYTVDKILVDIGDRVEQGDVLATFTSESLEELEDEIKVITMDINNVTLELENMNSGSLKLDLDSRSLEIEGIEKNIKILNRRKSLLKNQLKNLENEVDVKLTIFKNDGISSLDLNTLITKKDNKSIELEDNESESILMKEKYSLALTSYDRLKRELEMKRIRLQDELKKHQLNLRQLKRKLVENVKSNIDGIVLGIDVENGSYISEGNKIISLAPIGNNIVEINIPLKMIDSVKFGMKATVVSKNIYGDEIYEAEIIKISKVVNKFNKTPQKEQVVKATLKINEKNDLKSGSKVLVDILGNSVNTVKVIDAFSVLEEDDGYYVLVIEEGRAKKKKVELGFETLSKYQVLNLEKGEEIITNPFTVRVGDRLSKKSNVIFKN